MRIAILGLGRVGKAFVQLVIERRKYLKREGTDAQIIYVIDIEGGIYQQDGILDHDLLEIATMGISWSGSKYTTRPFFNCLRSAFGKWSCKGG